MDAGHRQGLRDVDRDDAGVRVRAAERVAPEHPRRVEVARVRELALHLRRAVRPARRRSPMWPSSSRSVSVGGRRHAAPPPAPRRRSSGSRCSGRGCRERLADLVVRRARRVLEQVDGGDDQARACRTRTARRPRRRTPPARGAARRPRRDALDGDDLVPVGLRGEDEARADERAVEQHRARAALALLAGVLRAGQRRAARAARRGGSRRPRRRPRARSPLTVSSIFMRGTARARGG